MTEAPRIAKAGTTVTESAFRDDCGHWQITEVASNNNGGVHFMVKLDREQLIGYGASGKDKASFSHSTLSSQGATVYLDRLQLPKNKRFLGHGPRLLTRLLALYQDSGCLAVEVPAPNTAGTRCYKKCGFTCWGGLSLRKELVTMGDTDFDANTPSSADDVGGDSDDDDDYSLYEDDADEDDDNDDDDDNADDDDDDGGGDNDDDDADHIVDDEDDEDDDDDDDGHDDVEGDGDDDDYDEGDDDEDDGDGNGEANGSDADDHAYWHINGSDADLQEGQDARARGTSSGGFVKKVWHDRRCKPQASAFADLNDAIWSVTQHDLPGSPYAHMKDKLTGDEYFVTLNRVAKAKLRLSYDDCLTALHVRSCTCRRKCHRHIMDVAEILKLRKDVFENCEDESEVSVYLLGKLRATKGALMLAAPNARAPTMVCRKYYAAVHGVAENKVKCAVRLAIAGARPIRSNNKKRTRIVSSPKSDTAFAWWTTFFDINCQRPNDDVRIFPVDKSYQAIYGEYFEPWFARLVTDGRNAAINKPKYTLWKKVRKAPQFADVKERAGHIHARCATCAKLRHMLLESFKNGAVEREYVQARRVHDEGVRLWRLLEKIIKAQAVDSPSEVMVLMHDGTTKLGLPRLTNRSLKNLDPQRAEFTPWLVIDYSSNKKDYIYTTQANTSKGSNTLISHFHAVVRRAKSNYQHENYKARKLIVIADSASENKNNWLFAYCTDLVENGWFDEVITLITLITLITQA